MNLWNMHTPDKCKSDIYYEFLLYCVNNSGAKGITDIVSFIESKRYISTDDKEIVEYFKWLVIDLKENNLITGNLDIDKFEHAVLNVFGDFDKGKYEKEYTVKVTFKGVDYVHQRINNNAIVFESKRNNILTFIIAIIAVISIVASVFSTVASSKACRNNPNIECNHYPNKDKINYRINSEILSTDSSIIEPKFLTE